MKTDAPHCEAPRACQPPLSLEHVGQIYKDAKRAIADVKRRRIWGDSRSGSPVSTIFLCEEIARLNLELARVEFKRRAGEGAR